MVLRNWERHQKFWHTVENQFGIQGIYTFTEFAIFVWSTVTKQSRQVTCEMRPCLFQDFNSLAFGSIARFPVELIQNVDRNYSKFDNWEHDDYVYLAGEHRPIDNESEHFRGLRTRLPRIYSVPFNSDTGTSPWSKILFLIWNGNSSLNHDNRPQHCHYVITNS